MWTIRRKRKEQSRRQLEEMYTVVVKVSLGAQAAAAAGDRDGKKQGVKALKMLVERLRGTEFKGMAKRRLREAQRAPVAKRKRGA